MYVEKPRTKEERQRWKAAGVKYRRSWISLVLTCVLFVLSVIKADEGILALSVICGFVWLFCVLLNHAALKKVREAGSIEAFEVQARQQRAEQAQERFESSEASRPVSAVLISTNSKKSGVNAVARGVVGGTLLGPLGAIAGAASGKSKATEATFSVKYANGYTGTETVKIGSARFNELSALMHE